MNAESRREAFAKIAGVAAGFAAAAPAFADRDYNEVGLLGGGQVVDVNNGTCSVCDLRESCRVIVCCIGCG